MRANPIAFELSLGTTYVRLSNTRLIADVTLVNNTAGRTLYVSTDGGATRGSMPPNVPIRLEGVDLNSVFVAANSAGTVLGVIGNSSRGI